MSTAYSVYWAITNDGSYQKYEELNNLIHSHDRIKSLVGPPTPMIYRLAECQKWHTITEVTSC